MWERMNYYYLWMKSNAPRKLYKNNRSEFYGQIKRINQLIHGIGMATMSHGEAWEFYGLGMYLERACQTARILDVKYHILLPTPQHIGTPIDNVHWVAILTSCSGYEPYHKQRLSHADPGVSVPDFLIFDALFPRSVLRCLRQSQAAAHAISGREIGRPGDKVEANHARTHRMAQRQSRRRLCPQRPTRGAHQGRQQHPQRSATPSMRLISTSARRRLRVRPAVVGPARPTRLRARPAGNRPAVPLGLTPDPTVL